jgi:hypothetical protein
MSRVKDYLKSRTLLTIFAVVMVWGALTLSLSSDSYACPSQEIEITFYTDASKTVECGYRIIPCNCSRTYQSGCSTAYRTTSYNPCY